MGSYDLAEKFRHGKVATKEASFLCYLFINLHAQIYKYINLDAMY